MLIACFLHDFESGKRVLRGKLVVGKRWIFGRETNNIIDGKMISHLQKATYTNSDGHRRGRIVATVVGEGEKCISTLTTEEFIGRDAVEAIILIEDTIARLAREKQWKSEDIALAYTSSQEECIAGEEQHGERATGRLQSSAAFCRKCGNRLPRDAAYCHIVGQYPKSKNIRCRQRRHLNERCLWRALRKQEKSCARFARQRTTYASLGV